MAVRWAVLQISTTQCAAQARAAAASTALGGLLATRDYRDGRARRAIGALGFQFLSAEMAHAWVHAYYNAFVKAAGKAGRLSEQLQHRDGELLMCAETDEERRRRAEE